MLLCAAGTPVKMMRKKTSGIQGDFKMEDKQKELAAENIRLGDVNYTLPPGHPVFIFLQENKCIREMAEKLREALAGEDEQQLSRGMKKIQLIRLHYAKTEELLMPLLYGYGVTGPAQVMWQADDEIKKEAGLIAASLSKDPENAVIYRGRIEQLLQRIQETIVKEEKILLPLSLRFFTEIEWFQVYRDLPEFGLAGVDVLPKWEAAEVWQKAQEEKLSAYQEGIVHLPTGEVSLRELTAIFKLLPVDLTFIDKDDILRFFTNEGKIFGRPLSALGREVYRCHAPHIIPVVRNLIADFKAKKRVKFEVWRNIAGKPVGVKYLGVYDKNGEYLGTLEIVQDFQEALDHFAK